VLVIGLGDVVESDEALVLANRTDDAVRPNVAQDAQEVLHSLVPKEREVPASGKRFFRVRMMPYRTSNNRIDGVVITLSDVSAAKLLEKRLTAALSVSEQRAGDGAAEPRPVARKRPAKAKRAPG